jgi:hypothetical protein
VPGAAKTQRDRTMGCAARGRCPGGDRPGRCGAGWPRPCALSLARVLGQLDGSRDLVIAMGEGRSPPLVERVLDRRLTRTDMILERPRQDRSHRRPPYALARTRPAKAAPRSNPCLPPPRLVCCAVPSAPCRAQPILASRPCLRAKPQVVNGVARIDAWLWQGRRSDRSCALQPCKALLPRSTDFLLTTVANMVTTSKTKPYPTYYNIRFNISNQQADTTCWRPPSNPW